MFQCGPWYRTYDNKIILIIFTKKMASDAASVSRHLKIAENQKYFQKPTVIPRKDFPFWPFY